MKGIILAGGTGSRLFPLTLSTCKQLLPLYDKPMIYYPLATLLQAGIDDILIITTVEDLSRFQSLLRDGSQWGISISYATQKEPKGIAEAFLIAEEFIANEPVALILGDNFFYGDHFSALLKKCAFLESGAIIFGYEMSDPSSYGVIALDQQQKVLDILEKPKDPPSPYAIPGIYFYDEHVVEYTRYLSPSERGELEITDLHRIYLKQGKLRVHLLERGIAWLDTGTPETLHSAASYIETVQKRQGISIGCIEEVAYQMGYIDLDQLKILAKQAPASVYADQLSLLIKRFSQDSLEIV